MQHLPDPLDRKTIPSSGAIVRFRTSEGRARRGLKPALVNARTHFVCDGRNPSINLQL